VTSVDISDGDLDGATLLEQQQLHILQPQPPKHAMFETVQQQLSQAAAWSSIGVDTMLV
jgi:hypothetical protein